ncbi:MAG: hypothetical protein Q4E00_03405 [Actinomyces bowdenii]|nr:hypothetical protein [Actinomyces bowdenii]
MGTPVQAALDVPADIVAGLVRGDLVRVGSVVRSAETGMIVKHLKEERNPDKEVGNGVIKAAQRVLGTRRGKVGVGIFVGVATAVGGAFVVGRWIS